jgi:hypothetical protein
MADNLWFFAVAIGPILLGAAILYGIMHRRRLSRGEQHRQEDAVEHLYDKPPGGREPSTHQPTHPR